VVLIKIISPELEIVQNIKYNRTKAAMIVNNVIGKYAFENLVARMKKKYFSILMDESTDKSSVKHLAIIVRLIKDQMQCNSSRGLRSNPEIF